MAVVKSPKNVKRKNLWILKNTSKIKVRIKHSTVKETAHFKKNVKSYKLLLDNSYLKKSIGRLTVI